MTTESKPRVYGTGLIALDLLIGPDPAAPIRTWAGGTCGNVLSILAYLGWDALPFARMQADVASNRVRSDLASWGVHLDFTDCAPTAHTPIIVQQIRRGADGKSTHRFSWSCPYCGTWLPGYRPITVKMAERLTTSVVAPSVFFLDRLSRGALHLAAHAAASGAIVVFEPSARSTEKLMSDALQLSHIIKYADNRLFDVPGAMAADSAVLLEIQTLGSRGLRYRHRLDRASPKWLQLDAIRAPRVSDTCGSGDWCTAGLIAKLGVDGQHTFCQAGPVGLHDALRFGQTLAAWNCGFEWARGGMYAVSREAFDSQIADLQSGEHCSLDRVPTVSDSGSVFTCPACPSNGMEEAC